MSETALTKARILEAAEEVLRRYGPSKATVVDVARALGVSHGSVYRHFASKAELREAVTRVWLARIIDPLETVIAQDAPALERLHDWLRELIAIKRRLYFNDPELFATYGELGREAGDAIEEHVDHMTAHVTRIIKSGVARGEMASQNPAVTARAVLMATARFHHPAHALEWAHPDIDTAFEEVWSLLVRGLGAGS